MSEVNERPRGTLRLYGAGGTGINIVRNFEKTRGQMHPGMATIHPVYADTSRSNIPANLDDNYCFIITKSAATGKDIDGGGKVRALNGDDVVAAVKPLLNDHPPMDMNVVVFSTTGGSGSVMGPSLMAELAARGQAVIGLVVGSVASAKEVKNAVASFKTLDNLARNTVKTPLVIHYQQNTPELTRDEVDQIMHTAVSSIAVLASRHNAEMDRQDIFHALRPDRALNTEPRVLTLDIFRDNKSLEAEAEAGVNYVTLASLYESTGSTPANVAPAYSAVGYLPEELIASQGRSVKDGFTDPNQKPSPTGNSLVFHLGTRADEFNPIYQHLVSRDEEFDRLTNAAPPAKTLLTGNETVSNGGIIY